MTPAKIAFKLRDGRAALLRSPREDEAAALLAYVSQVAGETDFMMRYPEEYADFTLERERAFLRAANESPNQVMLVCAADGKLVGSCQLLFRTGLKDRHRARVAIGILREYWSLGIGTQMFRTMLDMARARGGVRQVELDFIEGNDRARRLYERMGFRITGVMPDAVRLRDGRLLNEYMMVNVIDPKA